MDDRYLMYWRKSHEWRCVARGQQLFEQAAEAFRDIMGMDSGFFLYRKKLKMSDSHQPRIYSPWGVMEELTTASQSFVESFNIHIMQFVQTMGEGWWTVEELPDPLAALSTKRGLRHLGAWYLRVNSDIQGVVVLGSRCDVVPCNGLDVGVCVQQIEMVLDALYCRRFTEVHEQQFRSLVDNNPDIVLQTNVAGELVYANEALYRLTGYSREALKRPSQRRAIVAKPYVQQMMKNAEQVRQGIVQSYEIMVYDKFGHAVYLGISSVPIVVDGDIVGVFTVAKDLTKHIEALNELRETKGLYECLISSNGDAISIMGRDRRYLRVNAAYEQVYGWSIEEAQGQLCPFLDQPQTSEWVSAAFRGETIRTETRRTRKDGRQIDVSLIMSPVIDTSGNIIAVSTISRDITDRKRAEMALIEAEVKYRTIVEESLVGVYIVEDNVLTFVNRRMAEIFGYEVEEMIGMTAWDTVSPKDLSVAVENVRKRLSGEVDSIRYQITGLCKNGETVDVEVHGTLAYFNGKPVIIGTLLDITERIEAEEIIRKADKLAVVGQLAAGVAHEIRNPLTALKGFVQLMTEGGNNAGYCEIMLSELNRINRIIDELLLAARPSKPVFERHNVVDLVQDVLSLISTQCVMKNIAVLPSIHTWVPSIRCDSNQLKQVFLNILKNAMEAVPEGGQIEVCVGRVEASDEVYVRITDNGFGIDETVLPKLGEPFYTSKETGTGLGLMVSYRIVQSHGGRMKISSQLGRGTTVDIRLPMEAPVPHHTSYLVKQG
ncbi:PAS domain-containing sensor histidine kinase [Alicyclobacillus acidoterrestris]|uniref:histidine kinase n=1 Tax=Alicyclobacillus acidoterrestris (strain ATCC 49025 / DSM 3922 / CIP 106132 / NCIMB 13137 / GD3B) TaxID=1356854 RepID=T0D3Z6_ALIAG|nr:PAS domain-containing sensor histidine kinase [Alicyclobacillus acidoterrestris]EPZ46292.1 hypothetical protein N007_07290 [Alicyclobacillus acidoterrestris ATCC 49025]UNO50695.1 PAS domain S-box protein [Alicyclobacillus acidoterrestris]